MQDLVQQLRHTARGLARNPGFALVAVFTLALGIGANAVLFSVIFGVLIEPLPYRDADRLVDVSLSAPGLELERLELSDAFFLHFRVSSRTLSSMAAYREGHYPLTGTGGEPIRVLAARVTPSLLPLLGSLPAVGRPLTEGDGSAEAEPVALLSDELWQRRFGRDPSVIGRTIELDGKPVAVVGIMPASFAFPRHETDLWLPLQLDPAATKATYFHFTVVGRLAPGAEPADAQADLDALIGSLPDADPEDLNPDLIERAGLHSIVMPLKERLVENVAEALWILYAVVGLILLIGCANVANLFLARSARRRKELAVRTALGASRGRLAADLLAETILLATIAGGVGLVGAAGGVHVLATLRPVQLPWLAKLSVGAPTALYTLAISLLAGLLFGLAPLARRGWWRQARGLALAQGPLSSGGRHRQRARGLLVAAQVALALVLLTGSGLLVRTFLTLRSTDPGFVAGETTTLRIGLPRSRYPGAEDTAFFFHRLLERLEALPGVAVAGATSELPLTAELSPSGFEIEDYPRVLGDLPSMYRTQRASPGYFEAMRIPLLAGRAFERRTESARRGSVVVNRSFAEELWPGQDPLGKRLRPTVERESGRWYRIVGVVGDVRHESLAKSPQPTAYFPLLGDEVASGAARNMTLVLQPAAGVTAAALGERARQAIWQLDDRLAIAEQRPLAEVLQRSLSTIRLVLLLLAVAGGVALLLGAVGVYGVISYLLSQRTREIGVRMALGADRADVRRMVLVQGLRLTAGGIVPGIAGALLATRYLSSLLVGVAPHDPLTLVAATLLLLAVALLAAYLPARRAAVLAPVEVLRRE